jgi:hypothetical protein
MTWQLCAVGVGLPDWPAGVPTGAAPEDGESGARRWRAARSAVDAASSALACADGAALDAVLATEVLVSGRWLSRADAVRELVGWRADWDSLDVLVLEILVSGTLCAGTGYLIGIRPHAKPSCQAVHLVLAGPTGATDDCVDLRP